jgi:hypothetical protein
LGTHRPLPATATARSARWPSRRLGSSWAQAATTTCSRRTATRLKPFSTIVDCRTWSFALPWHRQHHCDRRNRWPAWQRVQHRRDLELRCLLGRVLVTAVRVYTNRKKALSNARNSSSSTVFPPSARLSPVQVGIRALLSERPGAQLISNSHSASSSPYQEAECHWDTPQEESSLERTKILVLLRLSYLRSPNLTY